MAIKPFWNHTKFGTLTVSISPIHLELISLKYIGIAHLNLFYKQVAYGLRLRCKVTDFDTIWYTFVLWTVCTDLLHGLIFASYDKLAKKRECWITDLKWFAPPLVGRPFQGKDEFYRAIWEHRKISNCIINRNSLYCKLKETLLGIHSKA